MYFVVKRVAVLSKIGLRGKHFDYYTPRWILIATYCSFKVYRSQLPRENPYYEPPVDSDDDDDESAQVDQEQFTPKSFKAPTQCVICGLGGSKFCGQCGSVAYCSREHQMSDWNMCRHKEFCNKTLTSEDQKTVDNLRASRIFLEKEIQVMNKKKIQK
ncbi:hypothetical protein G6F42_027574 [Rhizopus arrhizus]|nr:hypothetical protein G6F42_027574 [Rhizopus arrhizus]